MLVAVVPMVSCRLRGPDQALLPVLLLAVKHDGSQGFDAESLCRVVVEVVDRGTKLNLLVDFVVVAVDRHCDQIESVDVPVVVRDCEALGKFHHLHAL